MSNTKKTETPDTPAAATGQEFVFVMNYGLAPSAKQQAALDEREVAWRDSLLNGWVQDGRTSDGINLSPRDIERSAGVWNAKTARGRKALALANATAAERIEMWAKANQAPLVIECDGRKGQSCLVALRGGLNRLTRAQWAALEKATAKPLVAAITGKRILSPLATSDLLRTKDQAKIEDLIMRTTCEGSLAHVFGLEQIRKNKRTRIIAACHRQAGRIKTTLPKAA